MSPNRSVVSASTLVKQFSGTMICDGSIDWARTVLRDWLGLGPTEGCIHISEEQAEAMAEVLDSADGRYDHTIRRDGLEKNFCQNRRIAPLDVYVAMELDDLKIAGRIAERMSLYIWREEMPAEMLALY